MNSDGTAMVWRALADPTRRAILDLLADRARTTGELSEAFPEVSRFAVMKHLGVLETAGLVVVRRRGRERWNHLNGVPLREAYE
ncbi:MAG TPA: metalloregulator ArsR/SmtB family transcription factor, partial [Actinomycetota bacterium]|nr:metalloregulator ArsR/SmtB family transcription factor [Actinomycetota bacterium]